MVQSIRRTTSELSRHLNPALVSQATWGQVLDMGEWLPAAAVQAIVLECRLRATASQVDLSVRLSRDGGMIVAQLNPRIRLRAQCAEDATWRRVRALCAQWADGTSAVYRFVDHLWLEFDLPPLTGAGEGPPIPSCFIALTPSARVIRDGTAFAVMADAALHSLTSGLCPQTFECLARAVDALPTDIEVAYLAVMHSREVPTVRLYPARLAYAEWPRYLRAVEWPGSIGTVAAILEDLCGHHDGARGPSIGIGHIDIAHGSVVPRVGLEFSLDRASQMRGTLAEHAFLGRLVSRGLCSTVKRDALLQWPGRERLRLPHTLGETILARRVNDLKLVFDGEGAVEAKAYLTASAYAAVEARNLGENTRSTF